MYMTNSNGNDWPSVIIAGSNCSIDWNDFFWAPTNKMPSSGIPEKKL